MGVFLIRSGTGVPPIMEDVTPWRPHFHEIVNALLSDTLSHDMADWYITMLGEYNLSEVCGVA